MVQVVGADASWWWFSLGISPMGLYMLLDPRAPGFQQNKVLVRDSRNLPSLKLT